MSKGFGQILNQAKKMQEQFEKLQEEMETKTSRPSRAAAW